MVNVLIKDKSFTQRTFDTVVNHLRTQRGQSKDEDGCLYRGPEGRKCAIGALIPDELWSADYNCSLVIGLPGPVLTYLGAETDNGMALLSMLQTAHDRTEHWTQDRFNAHGEEMLESIAKDFGLTYTPPVAA